MIETEAAAPAGVRMALPGDWWMLPLDPKTRHQQIATLVDARLELEPRMLPVRNQLIAAFRRTARDAAEQGAVLSGCMAMSAEDSALSANALVMIEPILSDGAAGDGAPTTDLSAFQRSIQDTLVATGQVRSAQVTVVALPQAGDAVRLAGRRTVSVDVVGRDVEVISIQYFVPLPHSGLTAILTFTSPALVYEEPLTAMFDAIAGTFAFDTADIAE